MLIIVGLSLLATEVRTASAAERQREGLHGVVSQGPLTETDFRRMEAGGVEKLRFAIPWHEVQPAPETFEWTRLDRIAAAAGAHGVRALPFIWGTPSWLSEDPARPPIDSRLQRSAWQGFMTALVERYGPGGTFWEGDEGAQPIREWQIWNEPNFPRFYQPSPAPRGYARLVRLSAEAIRAVDPGAEVILGGVAPVISGPRPAVYLQDLYAVPGIKQHFDRVALHPYARGIGRLRTQIRETRLVMRQAADRRTPLEITEMGWASRLSADRPDTGSVRGPKGQARMLNRAFGLLERRRRDWRISGAQWFAWQDAPVAEDDCSFCQYAGLFSFDREPKPAWRAFRERATRSRPGSDGP